MLFFCLVTGWVCSVAIPDLTNVVLIHAPWAVHIILHLFSTFTVNITKICCWRSFPWKKSPWAHSDYMPGNEWLPAWCLWRYKLRWGKLYEIWLPGQHLLVSCMGFGGSITFFFDWLTSTHSNKLTQQQDRFLWCQDHLSPSVCFYRYIHACDDK